MAGFLDKLKRRANRTYTENGAVTLRTSLSDTLDLFSRIGAMRSASEEAVIRDFMRAYIEDKDIAMKILFYARDIRGGLGERRVFRVILKWLAGYDPAAVRRNIGSIAEFGRYDDLLVLLDTPCGDDCLQYIGEKLQEDLEALEAGGRVSLLAKWLPSVNASSEETVRIAKRIARALGMSSAEYRKALSRLRAQIRIIENDLRKRDYSFDYAKQPSRAMFKYRKAFIRNDHDRYMEYLGQVESGEKKLNTSALMPYDIIAPIVRKGLWYCNEAEDIDPDQRRAMDVSWNALEDFTDGRDAIAVIDGSGSMYAGRPMAISVALSLGMYFAERSRGAFAGHFITFSASPQLVEIKGSDIVDRTSYCMSFNEVANTDIEGVFSLLLETAVMNGLSQDELPETVYIISDMEFDWCAKNADLTNFENAKKMFRVHGYRLPQLVFWNVAARNVQVPVTRNEQGVVLVSGFTPRLFSMIMNGDLDPYGFMMQVLSAERYAGIRA